MKVSIVMIQAYCLQKISEGARPLRPLPLATCLSVNCISDFCEHFKYLNTQYKVFTEILSRIPMSWDCFQHYFMYCLTIFKTKFGCALKRCVWNNRNEIVVSSRCTVILTLNFFKKFLTITKLHLQRFEDNAGWPKFMWERISVFYVMNF